MTPEQMKQRTKQFALRVIRLVDSLPKRQSASILGGQLLRAATGVASNYRAACRARSTAEFIAKLGTVEEEADESAFWMEMLVEAGIVSPTDVADLLQEGREITAIVVASINTARGGTRNAAHRKSATRNPQSAICSDMQVRNPKSEMEESAPVRQSAIRNPQSAMERPQGHTGAK